MNCLRRVGVFTVVLLLLVGCKKAKEKKKIIGTWDVTEVTVAAEIFSINFQDTDSNPTGTIEFKKSGLGVQDYTFVFNNDTIIQDSNFTWEIGNEELIIDGEDVWGLFNIEDEVQVQVRYTDTISENDIRSYTITMMK